MCRQVSRYCRDLGLSVETKVLRGLLPAQPERGSCHDRMKTADIGIKGLDTSAATSAARILGNVAPLHRGWPTQLKK